MGRKKAKTRKPTVRQRKYVKGLVEGKSMTQAARDAGYSETTALNAKEKIESKPAVQNLFVQLMETAGITDEKLAQRLAEGLDAEETKFFQKDGIVMDSRDVIAYGERRAHLEIALKLKGHLTDKAVNVNISIAEILAASFAVDQG